MTTFLSRRTILAGLSVVMAGKAAAQNRGGNRPRGGGAAEIIADPRVSTFDIGPHDAPWHILVGMPAVPAPEEGYSAILAIDGNATFPVFWHHREALAADAPVVIIGIGYPGGNRLDTTRRWFDLTSAGMVPVDPQLRETRGPGDRPTGGRAAFLDMIAGELLPELRQRMPLNPDDMTLYGHSLGGLFVLHALFTRPRLFARFAAADPSTWWNAGEALREAAAFAGGVAAAGGRITPAVRLLIARSGGRRDADAAPQQMSRPEIVRQLAEVDGLDLIWRPHPDETHGSLIGPSAAEALDLHLGRLRG